MSAYYRGEILQVIIKMTTQNTPFLFLLISEVSQLKLGTTKEIVRSLIISPGKNIIPSRATGPSERLSEGVRTTIVISSFVLMTKSCLFPPSRHHLLSI